MPKASRIFAGTEVVEFSPTAEFEQTMAQVAKNLEGSASP
jgi:hypothetical protein